MTATTATVTVNEYGITHADGAETLFRDYAREGAPVAVRVTLNPGRLPTLRVIGSVPAQVAECDSLDHADRQARAIAARR